MQARARKRTKTPFSQLACAYVVTSFALAWPTGSAHAGEDAPRVEAALETKAGPGSVSPNTAIVGEQPESENSPDALEAMRRQVAARDNEIRSLKQQLESLRDDFSRVSAAKAAAEARVTGLTEDLRSIEARRGHLEQSHAALNSALAQTNRTIEDLEGSDTQKDELLERLRRERDLLKKQTNSVTDALKAAQSDVAAHREKLERAKETKDELTERSAEAIATRDRYALLATLLAALLAVVVIVFTIVRASKTARMREEAIAADSLRGGA